MSEALPAGRWITRRGVQVFEPAQPRRGRPRKPRRWTWTPLGARRAHAAYIRGERDPWTTEGEREYQRLRGIQRRAKARPQRYRQEANA